MHALGQVISVPDAPDGLDVTDVQRSLNRMCGPSISIGSVSEVAPDFHARFSARSRTYVYAVLTGEVPDPFLASTTWHFKGDLDVPGMAEAAGHLLGEHDFSAFGRLTDPEGSPVRVLFELDCRGAGRVVRIVARASSFIQQMVRSVAGTLVDVGAGKISPDDLARILAAGDRSRAGVVAPPHGLCLVSVEYDEGWSVPFDHLK